MSLFRKFKDALTSPKARILVRFGVNSFILGENVEGALHVISDDDFDADAIRCEIECVEVVDTSRPIYDPGLRRTEMRSQTETATLYSHSSVLSGPLHINSGFDRLFPFSMNLPAGLRPTYKSVQDTVTWTIKGALEIGKRPDVHTSKIEIQVIRAPAVPVKEIIREVVMVPCKYCGELMLQTATTCPHCGAGRE